MALGASGETARRRVLRDTLALAGVGIVIGTLGALAFGRAMAALLFDVPAADPVSFACMLALSMLMALGAGFMPAARAARVDPVSVLRLS